MERSPHEGEPQHCDGAADERWGKAKKVERLIATLKSVTQLQEAVQ
jgi:hypothetical protein